MKEHIELLAEQPLPVPPRNPDPVVTIRNENKGAALNPPSQATATDG
jgi:hypothetical protein